MTTTNLGLNKPSQGTQDWHTLLNDNFQKLEDRLTKSYAGDPNGNVASEYVGQALWDSSNNTLWESSTADGTVAGSTWVKIISQSYIDANGLVVGSGASSKGAGTINAGELYENGNRVGPIESGTWSATDNSGAGLSLSDGQAGYVKRNGTFFMSGQVTYPSNSDGNSAKILLPISTASSRIGVGSVGITSGSVSSTIAVIASTDTLFFTFADSDTTPTNADLSGVSLRLSIEYEV